MDLLTTSDGVAIAYHSFWPAGAVAEGLPPVVLQHGFAADTQMNWLYPGVVDALLAAGRQVISVDARGHGESDKPHDPKFYGEGRMAQDLIELFGVLGLTQLDLVGYSMGGVIALVTASQCNLIRRMVVGGIGAGIAELGGVDTRHLDTAALVAALTAIDVQSIADPVARSFRLFAESTGADCLALAAQAQRVHSTAIPLARITATTMVLAGEADPLAARPEVLAAAIPGATVTVIPGDHLGAVADPQFAPAIVRFLAG